VSRKRSTTEPRAWDKEEMLADGDDECQRKDRPPWHD
jgi:hypothetical protein